MKAKTGLEVLEELREAGVEGPVVLLTGQGREGIAVDAMKAGAGCSTRPLQQCQGMLVQQPVRPCVETVGLG